MSAIAQPSLVIEFHGNRARFQSVAHEERVKQVIRLADALAEKAVVDRDRLKVRARV